MLWRSRTFPSCPTVSTRQLGALSLFHATRGSLDGVMLLSTSDQSGCYSSLGTSKPSLCRRLLLLYGEIDESWMHFRDHLALAGKICVVPGQVSTDYMDWFFQISHSFVTPTQEGDAPRQSATPYVDAYVEPHVPEVSDADDLPRHSMVF